MCKDMPCVKACPTGALDSGLTDIRQAKMGLAVHVSPETCLGVLGMHCQHCLRACPVTGKAITLDIRFNHQSHTEFVPTVHSEHCTGCGKCEQSCPLQVAAIKVYPIDLAKGPPGKLAQGGRGPVPRAG
jgi:ferredoxin-type protein NapG